MGNRLEKDKLIGILVVMLPKNNKAHANIMRTVVVANLLVFEMKSLEFGGNSDPQMKFFSGASRP